MDRHIKLKHKGATNTVKATHVLDNGSMTGNNPFHMSHTLALEHSPIFSSKKPQWMTEMEEYMKIYTAFANSARSVQTHNALLQVVGSYANQISNIQANNWIIPKIAVKGLSGHLCNKCLTFSMIPVQEPGYDMTERERHRCSVDKAEMDKVQSARTEQSDLELKDLIVRMLINAVNFYMPGEKYLVAADLTSVFSGLISKVNYEAALNLIGIPDRWYLCRLEQNFKIPWVDRAIRNPGKKINIESAELADFLRTTRSTYAIFKIPMPNSVRYFSICIVR
jgi:hypothetical protein